MSFSLRLPGAAFCLLIASGACQSGAINSGGSPSSVSHAWNDNVIFKDGFEAGPLDDRWKVVTVGKGSVTIVPGVGIHDSVAAHLDVPDGPNGSLAYMQRNLGAAAYGVSASGAFKMLSAGCNLDAGYSAGNVPFFRFFDPDSRRVVGLYRINGRTCDDYGEVYVQHSGGFFPVGTTVKIGSWYRFELRIGVQMPGSSLVEVFVDGSLAYRSTTANHGLMPIARVRVHNEHEDQVGSLLIDAVSLATFDAGEPPVNRCRPPAAQPSKKHAAATVLADRFERNDFNRWSQVDQAADGSATIEVGSSHSGRCAALLHVTDAEGSKANLQRVLPAATSEFSIAGWFNVQTEGSAEGNIPWFSVFTGSRRIIDVFRANETGRMYLRLPTAGAPAVVSLDEVVAVDTWHKLRVHGKVDPSGAETVEVWIDGRRVHSSKTYELVLDSFNMVMVGSEHPAQAMDLLADDVVIRTLA